MSVITPTSLVGARSPIYITAGYSALAGSITDITLEVYIWSGARGLQDLPLLNTLYLEMCLQVKMYPFDIAPLVAEYIDNDYSGFDIRLATGNVPNDSIVWVQVDYDVNYINKADPPQTLTTQEAPTSLRLLMATTPLLRERISSILQDSYTRLHGKYVRNAGNEIVAAYIGVSMVQMTSTE